MTTKQQAQAESRTQLAGGGSQSTPVLPTAVKDAKATRELMFTLRHFHLGDPAAKERLEQVGGDFLPALLDSFRDTSRLRYNYPLLLFPADTENGQQTAGELARPLSEWLQEATATFAATEGTARILKDHLGWLEYRLRKSLYLTEGAVDAAAKMAEIASALQEHLRLGDAERDRLAGDLEKLQAQIPTGAMLLGYGRYAALHLLVHSIRSRVIPRRARFRNQIESCIRGLKELLEVDWGKTDESIEPAMARDGVGPGAGLFDAAALSDVMDHTRGTRQMSERRRERVLGALAELEQWRDDPLLVRFVHGNSLSCEWLQGNPALAEEATEDPCARTTEMFDQQAARLARVFAAVRIAEMEIARIYDSVIHDPWFANFNWEGFSHDELLLVPSVIAVEAADRVAREGLNSFSRLLSSGRPVQILIRVQASNNPGAAADEGPFQSYRTELGYLGISHRQAVVSQSSGARHQHLLESYLTGLDATRTSLHIVNTGMRPVGKLVQLNAWLVAGAAIESRSHPFFQFNPEAGDAAAAQLLFDGNPQPERDWPIHPFHYQDENGDGVDLELAFTSADYCLLIDRLLGHFRIVPPGCDSDALVPMQEYLAMEREQALQKVPFIWAVDGNGLLHRLVVSREMSMGCLDRLTYWRTLQEKAGVRNRYVELAVARTREQEQARTTQEREQLQAAHAAEVERVRTEAAGEVMQRLTDMLLGLDFTAPAGTFAPAARPAAKATPAAPEPVEGEEEVGPEAEVEEGEELSFDDPWIDTPLCTSCNDCMKVNPLVFVYNEEKQAYLDDLSTLTFAQMVEAAELCPAKCIHPGKPLNPSEPGLEELIERAAPFNQ
jgi:ferredoxin